MTNLRIEDYALIGDCGTAALVGRNGSIDWLCLPRFDSPACFAALLGKPEHGRWLIAPSGDHAKIVRHYIDNSLVLATRFETPKGMVEVVDFFRPRHGTVNLVRLVRGLRGRVKMQVEVILRFDYGYLVPWVERLAEGGISAIAGPERVVLRTPVQLVGEDLKTVGEFEISGGETVPFVLSYSASHLPPPRPVDAERALEIALAFWRQWGRQCASAGPWSDTVKSSLAVLKGLTYAPTGGIVAAPTTSLPERLGGPRNWDYRYCWLRDATFTLLALMHAGYNGEARSWRDWLFRTIAGSPEQIQIMYAIGGERRLTEWEVPWLPGFEGSRPVRIGNAASTQTQLDIFGEILDVFYHAYLSGLAPTERARPLVRAVLNHLATIWREPDEGIWEVRGGPQHFTHSKVMAWVAFDRAIKISERLEDGEDATFWREIRDEIHADVCAKAYDPELGSFVQAYGSKSLDAALLLLPLVGFLPPDDPRIIGTVKAIEQRLVFDGLVFRYDTGETADGLPPGEGAFLACSFWLADNYVLQGRIREARELFERLLLLRNDVGLLAEEYDPRAKRQLGNFPQAFSHVALVNTAFNLTRSEGPADQRSSDGTRNPQARAEPVL
ncbi:MAG: glycoside hydrolase family 15 protein [Alphaproteobacteria bacterium]|nr:glycoside hydrolase family 15 protein [Alphaproteobacteria bacterium]